MIIICVSIRVIEAPLRLIQFFGEIVTQVLVFQDIGSHIVDGCMNAYNRTILAYRKICRTGLGKTHMMFGHSNVEHCLRGFHHERLMQRACDAQFKKLCITVQR
uniref:Kinesin motor domain-containing protein n=1 Tax=Angiostrongylus cantonensis TaxID=6313 RepID=A0A0K0DQV7_ANGCA